MSSSNSTLSALLVVLVLCVGFSAAVLVRSTPSDQDRVYDFTVTPSRDAASWTAFGRQWTVHLELSDVMEDNTDYFHGTLEGDESAAVSFALLPGTSLSGMIITNADTWWIRALPLAENDLSLEEGDLGIFMMRETQINLDTNVLPDFGSPLEAEVLEVDQQTTTSGNAPDAAAPDATAADAAADAADSAAPTTERKRTISTYKVGVFYDQKWALASNNPWSSQANTMSILNDVNAVYRAAGLNTFTFYYLKQVSNPKTTLNDMLTYFSNTASLSISAMSSKTYTNYVWLVGSNVGGLAYVGTTCQGTAAAQNRKTAVTGLVSYSRLWTVKTIAHELGHNRGASHQFTNACTSTLKTNCQCSVMSYCFPTASNNPDGAVNKFSSHTINEMKSKGCY